MKATVKIMAVAAFALVGNVRADNSNEVGRYQLVTGAITTIDSGAIQAVFKIDTITGDTWMYTEGKDEKSGVVFDGWSPISKKFPDNMPLIRTH
jgi:predicted dinucleotide-utilizing enzyme